MTGLLDHMRTHNTPPQLLAALRALVRTDNLWVIALAALVGGLAGCAVSLMTATTLLAHHLLAPGSGRLSGLTAISPVRALLVPMGGGLLLGLSSLYLARTTRFRPVDPIEANALHGGRMSLRDSLILAGQTILSNGCGVSLGLEAGFSQLGAAFGSRIGRQLRMHRSDVRLLVGCGAAGAIGAAFDAPLAGAFYAFELIIGSYTFTALAPVALAAICGIGIVHLTGTVLLPVQVETPTSIPLLAYFPIVLLGIFAGLVGVMLMRVVTLTEHTFRSLPLPVWLHPALGGLLVGGLALVSPSVLSSGHMAMRAGLIAAPPLMLALGLLGLKALASAISIGSGFRGGLFFASLYLGVLTGAVFAGVLAPLAVLPVSVCTIAGMCALAVGVIGGPMTMIFLALETTGSLPLTGAVVVSAIVSSITVRRTFGYSFATWRFHLRGENIRSGVDVGWMRTLTVERMMRTEVVTFPVTETVQAARLAFPHQTPRYIILCDAENRYRGLVENVQLHSGRFTETTPLAELVAPDDLALTPDLSLATAIDSFERLARPALAVVDAQNHILGLLSERYVLRRYAEELERTRRELAGEKYCG
ncbi:chloride channel protein [Acetobacter farinalis]|uniref:Chloride channel protein n=1 Tax=Acetobacter farinalis TaxID=1260984 RepID=A0ABT3Q8M7_9PROT|nr:chloride channel protein [Acetobacter farinalis]MCX2561630.1 chloride channel protein [Acetobacter farinalis]NHO30143.1 CBS domain-containing protein [Acetobacter farinalis]